MATNFIAACNARVAELIPEFRQKVCMELPDPFSKIFYEYRFNNPYFGYVDVYNDACVPFNMLTNNDDLVATHYLWYGRNGYETASTREWIMRAKKASIIFDIGAHTGLFSMLACSSNPNTKAVVAFEPTGRAFSRIIENLIVNSWIPRVKVEQMAISDRDAVLELMHYDDNYQIGTGASYLGTEKSYAVTRREQCKATTIDSYVSLTNLQPDLVKLDVEGAEIDAMKGARALISSRKATFLIEVLPTTVDQVARLLDGYSLFIIDDESNATITYDRSKVVHYTNILAIPSS